MRETLRVLAQGVCVALASIFVITVAIVLKVIGTVLMKCRR